MIYRIFGLLVVIALFSCVPPPTEKKYSPAQIELTDSTYQKVITLQSSHNFKSLQSYVDNENPSYRLAYANAFASFQDKNSIDSLIVLLNDEDRTVRQAAAYSLGQIGDKRAEKALINSFIQKDTSSVNSMLNATILEAIGKCGSKESLRSISTVEHYRVDDNNLLLGQVRSIYRFMQKGNVSKSGTKTMMKYIENPKYPNEVRMIAAHYLAREKKDDLSSYQFRILKALENEKNDDVRMALATACSKFDDMQVLESLINNFDKETNDLVKINLLRVIAKYKGSKVYSLFVKQIRNKNIEIAEIGADYLIANGTGGEALTYAEMARAEKRHSIKAKLFEASISNLPSFFVNTRTTILNEVKAIFKKTSNPYAKANYLRALCGDIRNYPMIKELGMSSDIIPVRTASFEIMRNILDSPKWKKVFGSSTRSRSVKKVFLGYIKEGFTLEDVALISIGSNILGNEKYAFKTLVKDTSVFQETRNRLELPKELEAYNDLSKAMNYLFDTDEYKNSSKSDHKDLDWDVLQGISDSTIARIITEKGSIDFRFFTNISPETVANFIELTEQNYYDDKVFHRVVPNFVVQGGGVRGDGYGGMDYTIRSELAQKYYNKAGVVGMASAGHDTEGAQFFITHSPSPHLDGNYTIFGEVVAGMDVVLNIDIGDEIKDIQIIK